MAVPYLEAYVPHPDFTECGGYVKIPCTIRNIRSEHSAVEIHHSLFEGDRMTFHQILTSRDDELDWMRPIRFFTGDDTKLFDGIIRRSKYEYIGSDYMALKINAVGWWRELARMSLHQEVEYDGTLNANEIFTDLVRLANDMGRMKEAKYVYDTDKIPEYSTYSSYYTQATDTTFTFSNVYEGMQTLTRYLNSVIDPLLTPHTYEYGLRIESLPRLDGISQTDTESSIYVLPFVINPAKPADATFQPFQIATGFHIDRDYSQLANDCYAIGNGFETQQIGTVQPLEQKDITLNDQSWARDAQVLASHYLRVTIHNPSASDISGYIQIKRVNLSEGTNPIETFPMNIPAGGTQIHYTSERTEDGLSTGDCFRAVGMGGGKITIDEITNDADPLNTTIAGKSINRYGFAGKTIEAMWLNTQDQVNVAAGKHCRLYHAPLHQLYAPILHHYVSYDNLIGNTAKFYSPYSASLNKFLITDTVYGFRGKLVSQYLNGMRYEFDWDYNDS